MKEILQKIDNLLPTTDDGQFVAFAESISMARAQEAGYIDLMEEEVRVVVE